MSRSSVDTAPGSIQVTLIFDLGLNSILSPSLKQLFRVWSHSRRFHLQRLLFQLRYDIEKQDAIEKDLSTLLDKQQQVDAVAQLVAYYYGHPSAGNNSMNNNPELHLEQKRHHILMDLIGRLLLREDRSFHLIQMIEAALRLCSTLP